MNQLARVRALPIPADRPERADRSYPVRHKPLKLTPIAWGKPNRELARMVIHSIRQTTPAMIVPVQPGMDRIKTLLDTSKFLHY